MAKAVRPEKELYKTFANPDGRHRPYVRWWWNGARVNEQEILRELDVMREAGIGGVEINTIQFPDQTTDTVGCAALTWLSDEWIRMVNVAADGCRERGMVCDIIVGSGWPFGAEYLAPEEQVQMLYPVTVDVKGGRLPSAATRCWAWPTPCGQSPQQPDQGASVHPPDAQAWSPISPRAFRTTNRPAMIPSRSMSPRANMSSTFS